jgi:hypothetical protein
MIEVFSINLKPETRDQFHLLFSKQSFPLQKKWMIHVVAFGPSLHDESSYYVIRTFSSLEDRQKKEDDFYGSDDWQKGPRTAMLSCIENYTTVVISEEMLGSWFANIKTE